MRSVRCEHAPRNTSEAEELLADDSLVAGGGEAARLVSYIRQDESPHVEYLRTTLSEMRDRDFVTTTGGVLAGTAVIETLWARGLADSTGDRRDRDELLAAYESLASVDREAAA